MRNFKDGNYIQCVAFDPKGHYIGELIKESISATMRQSHSPIVSCTGVGFTSGLVGVLDSVTLEDVCQPFPYSRDAVTQIVFSHDSTYMATAVSQDYCISCHVIVM